MQKTLLISVKKYRELKHKAELLDAIVEEERLTMEDIEKIKEAEKTKRMPEEEFYSRYPKLKG